MMTATTRRRDELAPLARATLATVSERLQSPTGRAVITGVNAAVAALNLANGRMYVAATFAFLALVQASKAGE